MFWESVLGGIGVLLHWQVWIAFLVYVGAQFAWLIVIGLMMGNSDSGGRMAAGCLTHMIGGSVLQAVLLGVVVLFLTPIMLGGDQAMPLKFFLTFAWPILIASLAALVISFIMAFLPIIGRLITDTPGLDTFIKGIIIFRIFSDAFIETTLKRAGLSIPNLYPGFWASIGYFALAIIIVYACLFGFAALGTTLSRNRYTDEGTPSFFIGMTLIQVLGLLPLFMYANHVAVAIQQLVK